MIDSINKLFETGGVSLVMIALLAAANCAQYVQFLRMQKQMRQRDVNDAKFKAAMVHAIQGMREVLKELRR